jgi:hypothetical protein
MEPKSSWEYENKIGQMFVRLEARIDLCRAELDDLAEARSKEKDPGRILRLQEKQIEKLVRLKTLLELKLDITELFT